MNLAFDAATEDGAQVGLGRRYGGRASHSLQRAGQQAQQQQQQSSEQAASSTEQGSVADFAAAPWNIGAAGQQVLLMLWSAVATELHVWEWQAGMEHLYLRSGCEEPHAPQAPELLVLRLPRPACEVHAGSLQACC